MHYSIFLARQLAKGTLKPAKEFAKRVVYHDPCFLGKQNEIYDEPRALLKSIPGIDFVEFDRNRENSLCCEGGGGRMWIEIEHAPERLANIRVRDAVEMGAEVIAVACPFCLLTLEDAVKAMDLEGKVQVMDILEILNTTI